MEETTMDAAGVLADVRELRAVELAAGAALLRQAAVWADLHPALEPGLAATVLDRGRDTGCPLAGVGTPSVAADCIAELAAALGMSTGSGCRLVGAALELRHRLPRLWAQMHEGRAPAWVARSVAERTMALSPEAAGFVDAQVAAVAGRVGGVQLDRLVTTAIARYMPQEAERLRQEALERRGFSVEHDRLGREHGLSQVWGTLDLPDALALEAAVRDGARALAEAGSTDTLQVRRARAVGELARRQPALDLLAAEATGQETRTGSTPAGKAAERVVLYLHLSAAALGSSAPGSSWQLGHPGTTPSESVGRVENTGAPVTAGQIRDWCGRPDARVTVKPVIDLNANLTADTYRPPARICEQVSLRDQTCVFPWCTRPAHPYPLPTRSGEDIDGAVEAEADGQRWPVELDHIWPWSLGGATESDNHAPLCRTHHRLKTFAGWRYTVTGSRCYDWTSPHGYRYRRHPDGATSDTTPEDGPPRRPTRPRLTARPRSVGEPRPPAPAGPPGPRGPLTGLDEPPPF